MILNLNLGYDIFGVVSFGLWHRSLGAWP